MQNKIEYILFLGFSWFIRIIGLNNARRISPIFAALFYYLIPIRKKTVIENLTFAFPEYNEKKIKKIAFACYKSFVITLMEILYLPFTSKELIHKQVVCDDKELIIKKYNEGRGVILLSGHYGNWEYIAASVASQINIPFSVVVKDQRNGYVTKWMNKFRTQYINKVVPLGISIRQIYKELKDKHIVAMVADQRGPIEGIRVNFFGRPASVYPGPSLLAIKTGAPVLFGFTVRQKDYTYRVDLHEIDTSDLTGTDDEKVLELSRRHTALLEKYIRKHPDHWLWMHKRWKY